MNLWDGFQLLFEAAPVAAPATPDAVAAALKDIAAAIRQNKAAPDPDLAELLRPWKEYIVAVLGVPLAALLAWLGVRWSRKSAQQQLLDEQKAILRALSGELSATLYALFYLSQNIELVESNGVYLRRPDAIHQSFPSSWPIHAGNAGRVHRLTARAFAMLSTYNLKCSETAAAFTHALQRGEVSAALRDALFMEAGHGALIRHALMRMEEGDLDIQLTSISDGAFTQGLHRWRPAERAMFEEGRALWCAHSARS